MLVVRLSEPGEAPSSAAEPSARLVRLEGERVTLAASVSAPPGAPLSLRWAEAEAIEARVKSCKRHPDAAGYLLEARLVNLSKRARAALEEFTVPTPPRG